MPWSTVIFFIIAAIAIISAAGVVLANNPVHSAVFLVISFIQIAAVFVMLGAEFLGVIQIIVYTGAILVLVLFVIMLVDPDDLPEFHGGRPVQRVMGLLLGLILLLEAIAAITTRTIVGRQGTATPEAVELVGGNTQALGRTIYTEHLLAFELISMVLTVGVLGAIVLALPERLGERSYRRRDTISLGHPSGVDIALPAGLQDAAAAAGRPVRLTKAGYGRSIVMADTAEEQPVIGNGKPQ